jgi:N6-adenosine-specific RNA methylase IME4
MELNRDILRKLPLALRVEIEENAQHKPLTQSELAIEQRRILAELRKHATPGARTDLKATSAKDFAQVETRATKIVGKLFNESDRQVEKRLAIVDAAEAEPEKFSKLLADMDRSGRVNGVFRRLKVAQQAEQIRAEPPPLPGNGPYRVIVVDPPWLYEKRSEDPSQRGAILYPTMSIAEICAVKVASLAHEDCILWLWVTNNHMREAFTVLDAWGFEQKTILTWAKERRGGGLGDWLLGQTEHCLMAVCGKPIVELNNQTTLLTAPSQTPSQKPVKFYDLVESLCPAPRYADLFSRYRHNDKWDCHGDQAPPTAAAVAADANDRLDIPGFLRRAPRTEG